MTALHVEHAGSGPPYSVWLHGWGMHGGIWRTVTDRIGTGQALLVDLPGHGRSPVAEASGVEATAEAVASMTPPDSTVVGWSLGGLIALALAANRPRHVSRLVLVGSSPRFTAGEDWPDAMAPDLLRTFAHALVEDYEATLRRFLALQVLGGESSRATLARLRALIDAAPRPAPEALAAGLEALSGTSLLDRLHRIDMPVTLIHGARDTIVPIGAAHATARRLRDARVIAIEGAGHAPFLSHPEAFHAALDEALHR